MKQNKIPQNETLTQQLRNEVVGIVRVLGDKSLTVGFAESCTGGLLSSFMTELSGVSSVFMGSVVSYDNSIKEKLLKVSPKTLKEFGAVSSATAKQMAEGAFQALEVSVAVSITGIAGPTGGTTAKPIGTVFVSVAGLESDTQVFEHHFGGDRKQIQLQAAIEAIKHLYEFVK